ncbi:hypothetical protein CDAR_471641 [Caerostris darwini]|uniref:UDENN FLCN/SMCR8-type domain-containing protein n=1 Tax=Caerostris darwini TaxID=1538125 RepID=A0AAV4PXB6_9ARAC|nr:hypothetical protein CDAR_471641 [Caerostris darwini]
MLWSPNEVLAYLKEDVSNQKSSAENEQIPRVVPTAPFGGFQTWPSNKEDFVLIAENSEIHGPNPLFTIPELNSSIDLNKLATQILSADYQGLSNNKILPGKNAQLLMPSLAPDLHAAINYFFLFDSEARGFVRPTSLAYFTADKHKLIMLSEPILKTLGEVAAILQHSNILYHVNDLKYLKDSIKNSTSSDKNKSSNEIGLEMRLKDIQDILDIVEITRYTVGNEHYDKLISDIMEHLKKNTLSDRIKNMDSLSFSSVIKVPQFENLIFRPNTKTYMKNLYHMCNDGLVLSLYHLYIMQKYFRRKYEHIVLTSEDSKTLKGSVLYFGACITSSVRTSSACDYNNNKCLLSSFKRPVFSLQSNQYFNFLDHAFEKLLLTFIDKDKKEFNTSGQNKSLNFSLQDFSHSSDLYSSSSFSSGYLSMDEAIEEKCGHIGSANAIWDIIEHVKIENPGIEESFLQVLKLFNDTRRLLFAAFTRMPIIVISTPQLLHLAQNFVKALSLFIPRKKEEIVCVDANRQDPLKKEDFSKFAVVNFCIYNKTIGDVIPLEMLPSLCILNLKDCSLTAPTYTGCLLANIDQQIKLLSLRGPIFPVLIGLLLEIDRTIKWWHILTTSSADTSTAIQYVLSKGFNRLDMQIIEKLSKLYKN